MCLIWRSAPGFARSSLLLCDHKNWFCYLSTSRVIFTWISPNVFRTPPSAAWNFESYTHGIFTRHHGQLKGCICWFKPLNLLRVYFSVQIEAGLFDFSTFLTTILFFLPFALIFWRNPWCRINSCDRLLQWFHMISIYFYRMLALPLVFFSGHEGEEVIPEPWNHWLDLASYVGRSQKRSCDQRKNSSGKSALFE